MLVPLAFNLRAVYRAAAGHAGWRRAAGLLGVGGGVLLSFVPAALLAAYVMGAVFALLGEAWPGGALGLLLAAGPAGVLCVYAVTGAAAWGGCWVFQRVVGGAVCSRGEGATSGSGSAP